MRRAAFFFRRWPLLLAVPWVLYALRHPFDDDEFQHANFAWLLFRDQRPFVDFFEHHLPLYHLLAAPVYRLGEAPWVLFPLRLASVAAAMAVLLLTRRLARQLGASRGGANLSIVLLSAVPMFAAKMSEVRPEPLALALLALAAGLCFTAPAPETTGRRAIFGAGLAAGAAVALSLKYLFPAAGIVGACLCLQPPRRLPFFAAGGLVPLLLLSGWAAAVGVLGPMYEHVILLALGWQYRFSPAGYAAEAFETAGLLLVLGVLGLFHFRELPPGRRRAGAALSCLVLGALAGILLVPVPYRQTFLPVFPPLAVAAACLAGRLGRAFSSLPGGRVALALLLAIAFLPPAAAFRRTLADSPREDLALMRLVEARAPGDGPVFDGRGLLFYRPHVGRYPWMHHELLAMLEASEYAAETTAAITAAAFPPVIFDYRVEMMPPAVRNFIRRHYLPVGEGPLYLPGRTVDRAALARPGGAPFTVPVPGRYRADWRGGTLTVDGQPLSPGAEIGLGTGTHYASSEDYIEDLRFTLSARARDAGPAGQP